MDHLCLSRLQLLIGSHQICAEPISTQAESIRPDTYCCQPFSSERYRAGSIRCICWRRGTVRISTAPYQPRSAPYISTHALKEPGSADTGLEGAARLDSRLLAPGAGLLVQEHVVTPHVEEDRFCAVGTIHLNRRDQRCSIPIRTTYNMVGGERLSPLLANSGLALSG